MAKNKPNTENSEASVQKTKNSIIDALSHSEAEDGLYFRNFALLHEEDQRPSVKASSQELVAALNSLIVEGKVKIAYDDLDVTFRLT